MIDRLEVKSFCARPVAIAYRKIFLPTFSVRCAVSTVLYSIDWMVARSSEAVISEIGRPPSERNTSRSNRLMIFSE
jgi:hypothetical protein